MIIAIPTIGRSGRQVTIGSLDKYWLDRTWLVCPANEVAQFKRSVTSKVNIMGLDRKRNGIHKTRQAILDGLSKFDNDILMLDDDMDFCARPDMSSTKLITCKEEHAGLVGKMLRRVEKLLKTYAAVGISARQGNNHINEPLREIARMNNAYAIDCKTVKAAGIRFDVLPVMEDFDFTLNLFKHGLKNAVIYDYCWNQRGSGAVGGCSTYRTAELQHKCAIKLQKLHGSECVHVVQKNSKSGWKGLETRTDVRIDWRKYWKACNEN